MILTVDLGADYTWRAVLVYQGLSTSVKHTKNQLRDYIEKSQPSRLGSRYRDARTPARWAENLPCNYDCRANTFSSLNFTSEQDGHHQKVNISLSI